MTDIFDSDDGGTIMPFVVCRSAGGAYDDRAFAAGWNCALIDRALCHGRYAYFEDVVLAPLVPQLDLIAMRHGFEFAVRPVGEVDGTEWVHVAFTKIIPEGP